jgi:organic radical activating enzyme
MTARQQNFTIVVNWKKKGFGCSKVCSYCNWRDSVLLPHGGQSAEAIGTFIKQCKKSFVTISGGADPLYKFGEYGDQLLEMIQTVKAHGFKVRIITREVLNIAKLKGIADYVSISLDADVLEVMKPHQQNWEGVDIEYSLVLPPLPTEAIAELKPQYAALRTLLGRRLVLRENLNSIFPLDLDQLSFGHSGIVFVSKALCLGSRYLSTIDCTGHDIVQDNEGLSAYLMGNPDVLLFGGFVKHLVNPKVHMEYGDIDVISLNPNVIEALSAQFAFTFKALSPANSYPLYYLGKSSRVGKTIQLVLMQSKADALQFIHNAQYDVDRVGYSNHQFCFDPAIGEEVICHAINTKQVNPVRGERRMNLFHADRPQIEQRHKVKLLRKGFTIAD